MFSALINTFGTVFDQLMIMFSVIKPIIKLMFTTPLLPFTILAIIGIFARARSRR